MTTVKQIITGELENFSMSNKTLSAGGVLWASVYYAYIILD